MSKKNCAFVAAALLGLLLLVVATWSSKASAAGPSKQTSNLPAARHENTSNRLGASGTVTDCVLTWELVPNLDLGQYASLLTDIDATSSNDAWAVGSKDNGSGEQLLIQHWDGTQWHESGQDLAAGIPGNLEAVAAIAPDDVWAAGSLNYSGSSSYGRGVALLLHWGGEEWNTVQSPLPQDDSSTSSHISGLDAGAPGNIWAVGNYAGGGGVTTALAMHWDGQSWSDVPVAGGNNVILTGVSVIAGDDVWAVGRTYQPSHAVTMHWDGSTWDTVPVPDIGAAGSSMYAVSALGHNNVWAVGDYMPPNDVSRPWSLHWDGQSWHNTTNLSDTGNGSLYDVIALSPDDVWAAGVGGQWAAEKPLIKHWDGAEWTDVDGPTFSDKGEGILGLMAISPQEIWGAGWLREPGTGKTGSYVIRTSAGSCSLPTETPAGTATETATPSSTPTVDPCEPSLQHVDSLNNEAGENTFLDVEPRASDDVWASGGVYGGYQATTNKARVERFDGAQWRVVYESAPATWPAKIYDLQVVAPDDVWAVGEHSGDNGFALLHWNGEDWSEQAYPGRDTEDILYAMYAVSPDDVWAAGMRNSRALTLHWNGSSWSEVPVPDAPGTVTRSALLDLSATSANNVWAVGEVERLDENNASIAEALIVHWNGTNWSVTSHPPAPGTAAVPGELRGVAAISPSNVWAVGYYSGQQSSYWQPLVMHWDGTAWNKVHVPRPAYATTSVLMDIEAVAGNDIWMVGTSNGGNSIRHMQSLVLHWDGAAWSLVPVPRTGEEEHFLEAVAATKGKPGETWMVGFDDAGQGSKSLTLRLTRPCVTAPATATPSTTTTPTLIPSAGASVTTTATAKQPTNTLTATATYPASTATPIACSLQFADLPQGSTFQPFGRCLGCKGIISGYECGGTGEPCNGQKSPYFRPGSLVTRGQIAKIVANTLGLTGSPGAQQFEDVPAGAPFYSYVNRLAVLGVMSGYACGEPGESCGASNLPYFRPDDSTTRGQIAKIVANGAGYAEGHTGQTFEDVPATHAFYLPVERLASRGIMSGYDCGGQGEPCKPGGRPYFRPGANATRGQVAKIVSNTFFKDCGVK
ncbi:MAG: hypothetical protein QOH93_2462 [Chloroflexia bacterium]|nr:hypothetical protein [Chloroflexia bacterium]